MAKARRAKVGLLVLVLLFLLYIYLCFLIASGFGFSRSYRRRNLLGERLGRGLSLATPATTPEAPTPTADAPKPSEPSAA